MIDLSYYTAGVSMGRRRDRARTPRSWIATTELSPTGGHPFYQRLDRVLDDHGSDEFVEAQCASYAGKRGRPSLSSVTYFRLLLIGYFEVIYSERGIAWRTADSLALRGFLGLGLKPRRALDDFADASLDRSRNPPRGVHVDPAGDGHRGFGQREDDRDRRHNARGQRRLAEHRAGATRAKAIRSFWRRWRRHRDADARQPGAARSEAPEERSQYRVAPPHDPDARITKMKDGPTHLAHKAEHAVD
jgi:transposase